MSGPSTTIMPFASLPSCAVSCGPLYDANGGCVPPATENVDNNCFCGNGVLSPWFQGPSANVCPDAGCNEAEYASIQSWFTSYCSSATADGNNGAQPTAGTSTTSGGSSSSTGGSSSSGQNQGPGGDWISNHWRWVIGIVILVVAIVGIWIGACIWRRRYLRRKERARGFDKHSSQSAFPAPGGSTVHVATPGSGAPHHAGDASGPGMFMSNSNAPYEEKPKKKWTVMSRT